MDDLTQVAAEEAAPSQDILAGKEYVEAAQGFEPMPDYVSSETAPDEFADNPEGLARAAQELSDRRNAGELPIVERGYDAPQNQSIEPERAARDLKAIRDIEASFAEDARQAAFAEEVDN